MRTINKVLKLELTIDLEREAKKIRENLTGEFCLPMVKVLGGVDDGHEFHLKKDKIKVGRIDPENQDKYDPENDVVLSDQYKVVSRVWKPQALLTFENGEWFIEQGEGNPTSLWEKTLTKGRKEKLRHEDIIHLSEGEKSVRLVFLLPKSEG
jgi:hypothetical protein